MSVKDNYQLIGLDDKIMVRKSALSGLDDYKTCFDKAIGVPNLESLFHDTYVTQAILGRIFAVGKNDDWASKNNRPAAIMNNGGDYKTDPNFYEPMSKFPTLISTYTRGAVVKDDVGNTIIIGSSSRNRYFKYTIEEDKNDIFGVKRSSGKNLFRYNSGVNNLTMTIDRYFMNKDLLNAIKSTPINKQKVTYPIVIDIQMYQDNTYYFQLAKAISYLAGVVLTAIGLPTLGAAVTKFLNDIITQAEKNDGKVDILTISKDVLKTGTKVVGINDADEYIDKGIDVVKLINEKDYVGAAKQLNLALNDPLSINDKLQSATEVFNAYQNGVIAYNNYKKSFQATQDAKLESYAIQNPAELLIQLQKELSENPVGGNFFNLITQIAVGRNTEKQHRNFTALPSFDTNQGNLVSTLLNSGRFNTPELTKFVLDIEAGGQIDDNLLNYFFVGQIEDQIRNYEKKVKGIGAVNKRTIYLPYAIDTIKGTCIAKELNTNGYSVIWDGGKLINEDKSVTIHNNPLGKNYYLEA
jgi:hypothetical protein